MIAEEFVKAIIALADLANDDEFARTVLMSGVGLAGRVQGYLVRRGVDRHAAIALTMAYLAGANHSLTWRQIAAMAESLE